ncbi:Sucrose nonfermenting 4-like protein [Actinidia chinensis var. chinensis]|uniref:Sucrose nonfermenting 4-like protein n=1 Tax=Actinidia chinensis var. chinensis TaxID=1590841 RepID=A0A2R6PSB7_ACTCC|nr:Sucrose nonfermenting 4-like protein [Actinidia chinensis var. chinensis]
MVHSVFTWPYGGRDVFLCFSFSGRTVQTRMSLMEGSSSIFQLICDLPPGSHQYKFLVDGVWRFDDQLLYDQDEYGGINNVILVKEPSPIPSSLHGSAFTPTMDIDNDRNLQDEASSSGTGHHEPELQLLDSDVDISRRRLCMHLSNHKIYELIPNSGKVFVLDAEVAVKEAFHVMHKQGLAVVPIWDSNRRQFSGMLTASDFILILIELHRNRAILTDQQLEVHTISSWKEGKSRLHGEAVGPAQMMFGRPLIRADPDESLKDVALRILQNKISGVPIVYSAKEESYPRLLHIACLSRILRHICRHIKNNLDYLPLLRQPVGSLSLGTWTGEVGEARQLLVLRHSETLSSALNILIEAQISSIPIVDGEGALINVYSRSDITSLAQDRAYAHIQLDQIIMSQVLEPVGGHRYQTCTRSDPLYVVMERLSDPVVRRLIVIDARSQHVKGIITLSDVFNFILG